MVIGRTLKRELRRTAAAVEAADARRDAAAAARDAAVRTAHEEGASLREIAEFVGLSHMGVKKILERDEGPSPPKG